LVSGGAAIRVASTIVPPKTFMLLASSSSATMVNRARTQAMHLQKVQKEE
jgi:hypothetical protein